MLALFDDDELGSHLANRLAGANQIVILRKQPGLAVVEQQAVQLG